MSFEDSGHKFKFKNNLQQQPAVKFLSLRNLHLDRGEGGGTLDAAEDS
jgi:hypothetical protein